ncbi:MAG: hypothetical protein R3E08_14670 [Thiotrichaceae bacterium]
MSAVPKQPAEGLKFIVRMQRMLQATGTAPLSKVVVVGDGGFD